MKSDFRDRALRRRPGCGPLNRRVFTGRAAVFHALAGVFSLVTVLAAPWAAAAERQPLAEIRKAVEDYLRRQAGGLPGEVTFTIGAVDPRLNLAACPSLETFAAPGAAPWGKSTVGVRCRVGSTLSFVLEYVRDLHGGPVV